MTGGKQQTKRSFSYLSRQLDWEHRAQIMSPDLPWSLRVTVPLPPRPALTSQPCLFHRTCRVPWGDLFKVCPSGDRAHLLMSPGIEHPQSILSLSQEPVTLESSLPCWAAGGSPALSRFLLASAHRVLFPAFFACPLHVAAACERLPQ